MAMATRMAMMRKSDAGLLPPVDKAPSCCVCLGMCVRVSECVLCVYICLCPCVFQSVTASHRGVARAQGRGEELGGAGVGEDEVEEAEDDVVDQAEHVSRRKVIARRI